MRTDRAQVSTRFGHVPVRPHEIYGTAHRAHPERRAFPRICYGDMVVASPSHTTHRAFAATSATASRLLTSSGDRASSR